MPHPHNDPINVNVSYRSTNCWVISTGTSRLLVDLSRPGMVGRLQATHK